MFLSFRSYEFLPDDKIPIDALRKVYSKSPDQWPKPNVDSGVNFVELGMLGMLPPSALEGQKGKLKGIIASGKTLFFDPRLSGSNQIPCSSCHASDLNWTDGSKVAIGHDHAAGKLNTPTLKNVWAFNKLFWDGRSEGLEDQAANPITNPIEMHQDLKKLPLIMYNAGMPHQKRRPGQENDPLYQKNDKLLCSLMLSKMKRDAIISFMEAISGAS